MSSDNRLDANRRNAQRSTGPRTPTGKANSSRNATTHGLTSVNVVLKDAADKAAFAQLRQTLLDDLKPAPGLEQILFKQILTAAWNMERCDNYIVELTTQGLDPVHSVFSGAEVNTSIANLNAYHRRNERSFYKALNTLRELQTERTYRESSGTAEKTQNISTLVRTQPLRKAALAEDRLKSQIESAAKPSTPAIAYDRANTNQLLARL